MISRVVLLAATTLWAGLAYAQAPGVEDLTEQWEAAYNNADASILAALYAEDAELHVPEGLIVGQEAIHAYWALDMGRDSPVTVLTVSRSERQEAVLVAEGNYRVLDRVSGDSLATGHFAHLWALVDGQWRLKRDAWINERFQSASTTKLR